MIRFFSNKYVFYSLVCVSALSSSAFSFTVMMALGLPRIPAQILSICAGIALSLSVKIMGKRRDELVVKLEKAGNEPDYRKKLMKDIQGYSLAFSILLTTTVGGMVINIVGANEKGQKRSEVLEIYRKRLELKNDAGEKINNEITIRQTDYQRHYENENLTDRRTTGKSLDDLRKDLKLITNTDDVESLLHHVSVSDGLSLGVDNLVELFLAIFYGQDNKSNSYQFWFGWWIILFSAIIGFIFGLAVDLTIFKIAPTIKETPA